MAPGTSGSFGRRHLAPLLVVWAAGLLGCQDTMVCPSDLQMRVTPSERTIAVGESFTATAEALGCGGTQRLEETWTWGTRDTAIVAVEPASGRITGRAPGAAFVGVRGERYGNLGVGVQVIVR
jgi:hypothetical protein